MFRQAYNLIREILCDEALDIYIFTETGKHLAVIDAGAQVTAPAATILFNGGDISRRDNSSCEIGYSVSFALPFWGADAFGKCIDFVDFALPIFFDYKNKRNFILRVNPSINELDAEGRQLWAVDFSLSFLTFI